jgi:hypothetical protein
MHVWRFRKADSTPIDATEGGALHSAIVVRALERGPLGKALRELSPTDEEVQLGTAEIRGADRSIILVVSLDSRSFSAIGGKWGMGNHVTVQVCRRTVEGMPAAEWSVEMFETLCKMLGPEYGEVCMLEEHRRKNVLTENGGYQGIGGDIARYLPGIYWLNFFGEVYCDFIRREKLLSAPAYDVREVGNGVLVRMSEKPEEWNTASYKKREQRFLDHVGREYFFDRDNPDKPTESPWNLPRLPAGGADDRIAVLHKGGGRYEVLNPALREELGLPALDEKTLRKFGLSPGSRGDNE